ncbi:MAG: recombinase family protein [Magnetococcales bacterium]|nr:recombinase family protein [Magnetococcales bacterium]
MANIGYIRVSSYGQTTDRQLDGVNLDRRFEEKISAKTTCRPQLQACLEYIREGDTLHVHSIDRLARNLFDLQQLVEQLTAKGVTVSFHKERLEFSGKSDPIARLTLQLMGAFAEFERVIINERRVEGIAKARQMGKQIGAKPRLTAKQADELRARAGAGEQKAALAAEYGISRQAVYDYLKLG